MEFIKDPMAIEVRSFEIIKPYIEKLNLSEEETKIYSRIIHASGDVDYAPIICIHKDVVAFYWKKSFAFWLQNLY